MVRSMEGLIMKKSLLSLQKMKGDGADVAWVTAYDLPFACVAEKSGIDMILVGDSGGMVQLGYHSTSPVSMDEMIMLASAVRRGAPSTFLVGDMPQGSYEASRESAVLNALRFIKEADSDCIKLEGGKRVCDKVKAISDAGILAMGHLGLTPQSVSSFGGYRVQAKTKQSFNNILEDAKALQEAGAFAILLEAMPSEPAGQIARQLDIPVYGIGAGDMVDGQLVIMHDLMGFYQPFRPWFAKCYIPDVTPAFSKYLTDLDDVRKVGTDTRADGLLVLAEMAIKAYISDVRKKTFPGKDYTYPITIQELRDIKCSQYWQN